MDATEALQVIWMVLSDYAENCIASDQDALDELDEAWQLIRESKGQKI
jgi:hypothetical protein